MDIREANVIEKDGDYFLELSLEEKKVTIPLTEDKPNEVKSVFNELIKELKKGKFMFDLKNEQKDLYSQICDVYIKQLNNELSNVYSELFDYNLLETN